MRKFSLIERMTIFNRHVLKIMRDALDRKHRGTSVDLQMFGDPLIGRRRFDLF